MKKIAVLTATRADYGLLSPVIRKLMNYQDLDVRVVQLELSVRCLPHVH